MLETKSNMSSKSNQHQTKSSVNNLHTVFFLTNNLTLFAAVVESPQDRSQEHKLGRRKQNYDFKEVVDFRGEDGKRFDRSLPKTRGT